MRKDTDRARLPPETLVSLITEHAPCVVMTVGPPGAGKSTLAAALARNMGDEGAILSYAAHRAEVCGSATDPTADPAAHVLLGARLAARCAAGLTTVVDGTHHGASTRAWLRSIAAKAGVPVIAAILDTPLQVCLERQLDRPPPAPGQQHGLRVPASQVIDINDAIQIARTGLSAEGFLVYSLRADETTSSDYQG